MPSLEELPDGFNPIFDGEEVVGFFRDETNTFSQEELEKIGVWLWEHGMPPLPPEDRDAVAS